MVTNRGAMLIVLSLTGLFTTLVVAELASHEHFHSFEQGPGELQFESFEELLRRVPPVPKVPIEKRNEVKNARKKPAKAKQPPPSITGGFTSGFVLPRQPISLVDASSDGICYIKVPKTASTTVAGVVRRIAARLNFAAYNPEGRHYTFDAGPWCKAQRTKDPNIKIVTANLGMPQENWLPACFRKPILLGSVRYPLQREISYFNFLYTTTGKPMEGRMEQFYEWVQSSGMKRLPAQTKYLNGKAFFAKSSQTESLNAYGRCPSNDPTQCSYVRAVFNAYDFLFVADQMVDSLIVFKRLFNVTWSDLLHIPGKVYHYEDRWSNAHEAGLQALTLKRSQDFVLYSLAQDRIQYVAQLMGIEFHRQSLFLREHLAKVSELCDTPSQRSQCYFHDAGCGYPCFDEYAVKHGLDQF